MARLAAAHHSFAAVFDGEKAVTLTGEVANVEWTNPHFHFSIDVKDAGGAVTRWRFEGYPPNMLVRQGWQRDETLTPGATVTVEGWAARSEPNSGRRALGHVRRWPQARGRVRRPGREGAEREHTACVARCGRVPPCRR